MAASFAHAGSAALPALRLLAQDTILYTRTADAHSAPIAGLLPLSTAAPSGLSSSSSAVAGTAAAATLGGSDGSASSSSISIPPTQPTLSYRQAVSPASHAFDINPGANLVAAADVRSPTLLFWTLRTDVLLQRIIVPTRLTTVSLSPDGDLCAAGSTEGSLFLWQISTGQLLASFDAHYRAVTVLAWSPDGQALVSAGADSRILVWSLAGLLAPEAQSNVSVQGGGGASSAAATTSHQPHAYATLADHTLPITSLAFPPTARFPAPATLWSTSLDGSLKLWDLRTRSLLFTYATPFPLQHLACDALNRFVYVSTAPPNAASASAASSSGGKGSGGQSHLARVLRIDVSRKRTPAGTEYFAQHEAEIGTEPGTSADGQVIRLRHRITSLALSPGSSHLVVGTAASHIHVFDTNSAQTLAVLNVGPSIVNSASGSGSGNGPASSSAPSLKAGAGAGGANAELGGGPGTCFAPGAVTNIKIATLAPVQSRMSAAMGSLSGAAGTAKGKGAAGSGGGGGMDGEDAVPLVASNFARTVTRGAPNSNSAVEAFSEGIVWRRIPRDLDKISPYITSSTAIFPLFSGLASTMAPGSSQARLPLPGLFPSTLASSSSGHASISSAISSSREADLEAEVVRLRTQLEEANQLNERMYALVGSGDGAGRSN
ncbi:Pre-rRNA-processing protein ipi3 [Tilletia horrida]|uniref:Pre-rRNA-processing protein IPI3 n=1 Tax=Tilletia horrida TaxID=155126 RepID=A0AAN6GER6_9BASI|nr:Pre-rRNA-processing protein ipi3 [Tilletia horrida]